MTNLPVITIVATTYFPDSDAGQQRRLQFTEVVSSWSNMIRYPKPINLFIADDGSPKYMKPEYVHWHRGHKLFSQQFRRGVGASLNAGFKLALENGNLVLYMVDDWSLTQPFDLEPWSQLLMEREDVGMVRLGPPHPNLSGSVEVFTSNWNGWGLRLDRHNFAFAHRPALFHKRMLDFYGWFDEDCSALECERLYNSRFCNTNWSIGPDIVLALPHPFQHLESTELAYLDPKESK